MLYFLFTLGIFVFQMFGFVLTGALFAEAVVLAIIIINSLVNAFIKFIDYIEKIFD